LANNDYYTLFKGKAHSDHFGDKYIQL
jgi:hypothetical protein